MNKNEAKKIIEETFSNSFNEERFLKFISNLFKNYKTSNFKPSIKNAFLPFISEYGINGVYEDKEGNIINILRVNLNKESSLERARTAQRNFVADYLKRKNKNAALVAFVSPDNKEWRLSLVKLESSLKVVDEKLKTTEEITPAKRWSFLVGKNEGSHTAQSRFVNLLISDENPNLAELESAFDIEKVTNEFFNKYTELYFQLKDYLDILLEKDEKIKKDFKVKEISTVDFAKKTLGQIVFLYFLQKKGWFGVAPDKEWGEGPKKFLRELFERRKKYGDNFFNNILEPLFYEALAQDRGTESIYSRLNNCRMPFLNGGLFEPMNGYLWETTEIIIPDDLFSNNNTTKEGDKGDGILDVFDRYNFTVNENEPLEKEVAVDPEMLGKVFENLLDIKDRKSKGAFYTPREIVYYMCQESLINYLDTETNNKIPRNDLELFIQKGDGIIENDKIALARQEERVKRYGVEYKDQDSTYSLSLPASIRGKAEKLDELLKNIKIADPAVGSGAFPLGMINEIVRARKVLNVYLKTEISDYEFKKHTITHSIYGVDIDPGAVDIAKLRLWLSLVVDEETPHPLPNLEHKIMQGNSLISEYEGIKLFDENLFEKVEDKEMKQAQLGFGKTKSELKMESLQGRITLFVNESQRSKKQNLKKEIDDLKWELIEETLKEQGKDNKLEEVKVLRKKNIKPFFIWKLEFSDVFKDKGGFDVVIGNPPYVDYRKINLYTKNSIKNFKVASYSKMINLYNYFFEIGINLLTKNGILTYISPQQYLILDNCRGLRDLLRENSVILLADFARVKVFHASTYTFISIIQKNKSSIKASYLEFDNIYNLNSPLRSLEITNPISEPLNISEHSNLISKIENKGIIKLSTVAEVFCASSSSSLQVIDKSESEKKFITASDIKKWYIEDTKKFVVEKTYSRQSAEKQKGETIYTSRMTNFIRASLVSDNKYLGGKVNVVKAKSINELFLVSLLNSNLINFWYRQRYSMQHMQGGALPINTSEIKKIPLVFDDNIEEEIKLLAKQIFTLKQKNKYTNIKNFESKINQLIYKLYGLTDEEIKIVEDSLKK